jgi:putative protease
MKVTEPIIELLSPAGCYASLQAAIDARADAVYFGLAQLNMRARSRRSFCLSDLPKIIERCHQAGVRGYLTINTLMYEHDLCLMDALLKAAVEHGVDAVIAADMACVLRAREMGLEVHLSTQLSISNYPALAFYAQYCDRFVLARELNLSMIRKIHEQIEEHDLRGPSGRRVEIEVFAHGALCIAVSGRCGMSLYTDNASANRGACVQNCRKEYTVKDKESGKELVIDNNFIMSPNDISTIAFLDEVLQAGVHTLKIEGRGRSPEYVALVTRAYRSAIDAIAKGNYSPSLIAQLLMDLKKVYNRGLSDGYYLGRPQGWSAAYGSKATQQKILRGRVVNYFAKISVAEVVANAEIKSGENYLIIGNTTGVIEGRLDEIRLETGVTLKVQSGAVFSFKVARPVRRNDQFFVVVPSAQAAPQQ